MLFETIRCENGIALNIDFHVARMSRFGGKNFDLSFLKSPTDGVYRCKLIYKDDIISVEFLPYEKKEIKTLKVIESDISYSYKFVDRSGLEALFKKRDGADDILIAKNSTITDTTISNIAFLDKNGRWLTPKRPLLEGTTRHRLIKSGFLTEYDIRISDIDGFEKIAIMNALRGFEPIGLVKDVIKF